MSNVKPKTIKLVEENLEENLCALGLEKDFLTEYQKYGTSKYWQLGL